MTTATEDIYNHCSIIPTWRYDYDDMQDEIILYLEEHRLFAAMFKMYNGDGLLMGTSFPSNIILTCTTIRSIVNWAVI